MQQKNAQHTHELHTFASQQFPIFLLLPSLSVCMFSRFTHKTQLRPNLNIFSLYCFRLFRSSSLCAWIAIAKSMVCRNSWFTPFRSWFHQTQWAKQWTRNEQYNRQWWDPLPEKGNRNENWEKCIPIPRRFFSRRFNSHRFVCGSGAQFIGIRILT